MKSALHRFGVDLVELDAAGGDFGLGEAASAGDGDLDSFDGGGEFSPEIAREFRGTLLGDEADRKEELFGHAVGNGCWEKTGDGSASMRLASDSDLVVELIQGLIGDEVGSQEDSVRAWLKGDFARDIKDGGAVTPKWASSIEPRLSARAFLRAKAIRSAASVRASQDGRSTTRMVTSGSVMPLSSFNHSAEVVIGTREGLGVTIVCPKSASQW